MDTSEERTFEESGISFAELARIYLTHIWIVLLFSVVAALAAFFITYFTVPKTYKATARVYINNSTVSLGSSTSISLGDLNASTTLVPTYSNLVKAEYHMLETVQQRSTLDYTVKQIKSMVTCSSINNTAYLDISVTSPKKQDSILLVNLIVEVLKDEKVGESIEGSTIRIIDPATEAQSVSRGFTKKTLYGFIVGFLLSIIYIFLRYVLLDDRIDTEEWLKKYYRERYPLLTVVPDMDVTSKHGYGYYVKHGYYGYYEKTEEQEANNEKE